MTASISQKNPTQRLLDVVDCLSNRMLCSLDQFFFCRGLTAQWQDCTKEPHYAPQGKRARTCFAHKKEEWVHVSRRRCDMDGCPRGAYFSLQESAAIFCSMHRFVFIRTEPLSRPYTAATDRCAHMFSV